MNHLKNIGALKADYEAGINSRVDIANKHGISPVTLWRYASKGKWSYGKNERGCAGITFSGSHRAFEQAYRVRY